MNRITRLGVNKDKSILCSSIGNLKISKISKESLPDILANNDYLICENIWQEIETNLTLAEYLRDCYKDEIYNKVIALLNIQYNNKLKDAKVLFFDDTKQEISIGIDNLNNTILSNEYKIQSSLALYGLLNFIDLNKRIDNKHETYTHTSNGLYAKSIRSRYWYKDNSGFRYMAGSTIHNVVQQYLCLDNSDKIDKFRITVNNNRLSDDTVVVSLIGFNNLERYSLGQSIKEYIQYIDIDYTGEDELKYVYSPIFHNKVLKAGYINKNKDNKYLYLNAVLNMLRKLHKYTNNIYLYGLDRDTLSFVFYNKDTLATDLKYLSIVLEEYMSTTFNKILISNIKELENGSMFNYYRINTIDIDKISNIKATSNTILSLCGNIQKGE